MAKWLKLYATYTFYTSHNLGTTLPC